MSWPYVDSVLRSLPRIATRSVGVLALAAISVIPIGGRTAGAYEIRGAATHTVAPAMNVLEAPNAGAALSIRSGLRDIAPCDDASRNLRPIWVAAARQFELRWQILAAISKIESDFGCNMGTSSAGAVGWTQFLPSTWDSWGMDADGDGVASTSNAVDAVFSTARYLRASGAPGDYARAIFAYNHADWYVRQVLDTAESFGQLSPREYSHLTSLAGKGARLQAKLDRLTEELERTRSAVSRLRVRLRANRRELRANRERLRGLRQALSRKQGELDRRTLQYIAFTQEISLSAERPQAADQEALEYLATASEGDAALVYVSARAILNQQAEVLDGLRRATKSIGQLQSSVEPLVAANRLAVQELNGDLGRKLAGERRVRAQLRDARLALTSYMEVNDEFRAIAGEDLIDSPFTPGADVQRGWRGKYRWPVSGKLSSPYSSNRCLNGTCRAHEGIDVAAAEGTPLHASAAGEIETMQDVASSGGYGNFVCIRHPSSITTCYAHLSRFAAGLAPGQRVTQGQVIGSVGNTGRSFGAHLHFEVRTNGHAVDPMPYMPQR